MKKPEKPPVNGSIWDTIFNTDNGLSDFIAADDNYENLLEIEQSYPYWEDFKYKAKDLKFDEKSLWNYVKTLRHNNYIPVRFYGNAGNHRTDFKYNTTNTIQRQLHEFDLNIGGVLLSSDKVDAEDKEQYLLSSIMEEAIASSQLEGAVTTREVAKEMLLKERKPRNYSEQMIANNYAAIRKIIEWKGLPITKERILELHAIATKDTLQDEHNAGNWRTTNDVKVVDDVSGEVFYTPPSHEYLEQLMDAYCRFANGNSGEQFIHPIIRGIILHFLIGYIHPFVDGNGRTARAIFYWHLINKGYWMIEYLSISRIILRSPAKYARAYLHTEYDDNDLTYFIIYNLDAMEKAMDELKLCIKRKVAEKKQMHRLQVHQDVNERQLAIIKLLIDKPETILTIKEVQNRFGIVYQTARTDLMSLVTLGYLHDKQNGKKFIYFRSPAFEDMVKEK